MDRLWAAPSPECGLIPSENLTVSGDGTAVHTHASPRDHRGKHTPGSASSDVSAPRHYSDPDASCGWDSDLDKHYYGYTLFSFCCYNSALHTDIPLFFRFTSARRHDSVNALVVFHELETHMPQLPIKNMCFDSAMDNLPTYILLKDRKIRAFIDLNSKYGRVIKTKSERDIRLYTDVPRGIEAYKKLYNQRTATERINNRILNDYGLHRLIIHRKEHYSFLTANWDLHPYKQLLTAT